MIALRRAPIPEEELILRLSATAGRRHRQAASIADLAGRADHELLAALMKRQRLFPLLGTRLVEMAPGSVPPGFAASLEEAIAAARQRGLVLETLDLQIRKDLSLSGIAVLPLKGTSLSRELYGDPGMRSSGDIDVLVELRHLERAAEILAQRGYRRAGDGDDISRRLHLTLEHPKLPPIEVHWRVHWYEEVFSQQMLRRSEASENGLRALPEDELASLLLFLSRDGLAGLRLATDAAAWWDLHGRAHEVGLLDGIAAEAPALRSALTAAAIALDQLVGIPAASLLSKRPQSRRTLTATRLANWTVTGDLDQIGANITLVDWLLSPPGGGWSFARRTLLPSADRIDSMYGLPGDARWRRTLWRAAHAPKLLLRYLIALWQVRGGRSWMPIPSGPARARGS